MARPPQARRVRERRHAAAARAALRRPGGGCRARRRRHQLPAVRRRGPGGQAQEARSTACALPTATRGPATPAPAPTTRRVCARKRRSSRSRSTSHAAPRPRSRHEHRTIRAARAKERGSGRGGGHQPRLHRRLYRESSGDLGCPRWSLISRSRRRRSAGETSSGVRCWIACAATPCWRSRSCITCASRAASRLRRSSICSLPWRRQA